MILTRMVLPTYHLTFTSFPVTGRFPISHFLMCVARASYMVLRQSYIYIFALFV